MKVAVDVESTMRHAEGVQKQGTEEEKGLPDASCFFETAARKSDSFLNYSGGKEEAHDDGHARTAHATQPSQLKRASSLKSQRQKSVTFRVHLEITHDPAFNG